MPTPALVAMSTPPACQDHLSLGRVVRHLSEAPYLTIRQRSVACIRIKVIAIRRSSRILGRSLRAQSSGGPRRSSPPSRLIQLFTKQFHKVISRKSGLPASEVLGSSTSGIRAFSEEE